MRNMVCTAAMLWWGSVTIAEPMHKVPLVPGWEEVQTGGDTICGRGEPYSFFVAKGASDKVVIDYIGGGACWNRFTCAEETATFSDSIDELRRQYRKGLEGVYDRSNPENPFFILINA